MKLENIHFSAIKYFIDTVQMKSLTKAADKNFVSRPAISQSIKRLEEWSGHQLITHDKRVFALTEQGQNLFRLLNGAYEDFQSVLDRGITSSQSLKLGVSSSLIDSFLVPSLVKLKHIDIFTLKTGTSAQLHELLASEEINISIAIDSKIRNEKLSKVLHQGYFVLASLRGRSCEKYIVTEDRPEVLSFKKTLDRKMDTKIIRVESWATGLKVAAALNMACLVPDILVEKPFKKMDSSKFKFGYKVILEHRPLEHLSEAELLFIRNLK